MTTAILNRRPANVPGLDLSESSTAELARIVALDRIPTRRQLVCRWRRDAAGRIVASWQPDI